MRARRRDGSAGRRVARLALIAAALVLVVACGKRGPPTPPPPRLPVAPSDVTWRQRGERLELRARYEIALGVGEASLLDGWRSRSRRGRELVRAAQPIELGAFDEATIGESLVREDALAIGVLPEGEGHVLAVVLSDRFGASLPAGRATLQPARPGLRPPASVSAAAREDGVLVRWQELDARASRVRVYREVDGEGSFWSAWRTVSAERDELLDETVRYGQRLAYAVTASMDGPGVLVESDLAETRALVYEDVFPPQPPQAVDAVALTGKVRVLWSQSPSEDAVAVIVERQTDDEGPWRQVGETPVPDTFFVDEDVRTEGRYRYRARSVDGERNLGDASPPTPWVAPRPPERPSGAASSSSERGAR
jgi:hypothetical protein